MVKVNFWERTSINVVANVGRTLVMALIGLFLIPYYLSTLGVSTYAIIPLATTICSYVLVISDSLTNSCGRYVVLAIRENKGEDAVKTYSTSIVGTVRVCLTLLPICLIISYLSPDIFNVPEGMAFEIRLMFALVLLSSLIVSCSSVMNSLFLSNNTSYYVQLSRLFYTIMQVALIILLFTCFKPNLIYIGIAYLASSLGLIVCLKYFSRYVPNAPKFRRKIYDRKLFKKIGVLSVWAILSQVGSLLYIQLSLVLVNMYLGAEVQAGFAILSTMISMIGTAVISVSSSMSAILYRLYADKRTDDLIKTIHVGEKLFGMMLVMPVAFLGTFASNIFTTWVGSDYTYLATLTIVASAGYMIHCCTVSMTPIPYLYLKNQYSMINIVVFGVMNAVLTFLVLQFTDFGIDGAVAVWAICFFLQELGFITICMYITHAKPIDYLWPVAQMYMVWVVYMIIFGTIANFISIGDTWFSIIPIFFAFYLIHIIVMFKLLLRPEEIHIIQEAIPKAITKFLKAIGHKA